MTSIRSKFHPHARQLVQELEQLFSDPSRFQSRDPLGALNPRGNAVSPRAPDAEAWSLHGAVGKLSYELFGHAQWKLGLLHDLEAALDRLVRVMDPKELSLMGWASRPWRTHTDILELLARLRMELAEDIELPFDNSPVDQSPGATHSAA